MLWYHLVRRSSYCLGQWSSGKWRTIVPGTLGMRRSDRDLQGKAGENGQPGSCLRKSSLQETVGYAGGKLPAGVANDWVTCRSSKQHHGPHRLHFSVREKRERNPAQGAPQGQVETKRSPKDSSGLICGKGDTLVCWHRPNGLLRSVYAHWRAYCWGHRWHAGDRTLPPDRAWAV